MAAALDEPDPGQHLARSAPCHDRRIVTLHPRPIREWDVHRRSTEGVAPLDHGAVEVRMREGDTADAAPCAYRLDGGVVDVADAVPEDIPVRGPHEKGALPDAQRRLDADADEAG